VNWIGFPRLTGVPEFQRLDAARRFEVIDAIRTGVGRFRLIVLPAFAGCCGLILSLALWFVIAITLGWLMEALRGPGREWADHVAWFVDIGLGLLVVAYAPVLAGAWADHLLVKRAMMRLVDKSRCRECGYSLIGLRPALDGMITCPECGKSKPQQ
jgi:hypothetical protein